MSQKSDMQDRFRPFKPSPGRNDDRSKVSTDDDEKPKASKATVPRPFQHRPNPRRPFVKACSTDDECTNLREPTPSPNRVTKVRLPRGSSLGPRPETQGRTSPMTQSYPPDSPRGSLRGARVSSRVTRTRSNQNSPGEEVKVVKPTNVRKPTRVRGTACKVKQEEEKEPPDIDSNKDKNREKTKMVKEDVKSEGCSDGESTTTEEEDDEKVLEKSENGKYIKYSTIIGKGAFKVVYKGSDTATGEPIAWCELQNTKKGEERERFKAEAEILKGLNHANIVRYYDYWETKRKSVVLVTELMNSGTLKTFLKNLNQIKPKVLKKYSRQVLRGLHYLHTQKPPIVHRDLKCDNIFINGSDASVKIGDLGLATFRVRSCVKSVIGTPEFMAPEMYEENYNEKVDVYSFGMCLIEMATMEYPYLECAGPMQILRKVTRGDPPDCLLKVDDSELKDIILWCIQANPVERPTVYDVLNHPFFLEDVEKDPGFLLDVQNREEASDPQTTTVNMQLKVMDNNKKGANYPNELAIAFPFDIDKDTTEEVTDLMVKQQYITPKAADLVKRHMELRLSVVNCLKRDRLRRGGVPEEKGPIGLMQHLTNKQIPANFILENVPVDARNTYRKVADAGYPGQGAPLQTVNEEPPRLQYASSPTDAPVGNAAGPFSPGIIQNLQTNPSQPFFLPPHATGMPVTEPEKQPPMLMQEQQRQNDRGNLENSSTTQAIYGEPFNHNLEQTMYQNLPLQTGQDPGQQAASYYQHNMTTAAVEMSSHAPVVVRQPAGVEAAQQQFNQSGSQLPSRRSSIPFDPNAMYNQPMNVGVKFQDTSSGNQDVQPQQYGFSSNPGNGQNATFDPMNHAPAPYAAEQEFRQAQLAEKNQFMTNQQFHPECLLVTQQQLPQTSAPAHFNNSNFQSNIGPNQHTWTQEEHAVAASMQDQGVQQTGNLQNQRVPPQSQIGFECLNDQTVHELTQEQKNLFIQNDRQRIDQHAAGQLRGAELQGTNPVYKNANDYPQDTNAIKLGQQSGQNALLQPSEQQFYAQNLSQYQPQVSMQPGGNDVLGSNNSQSQPGIAAAFNHDNTKAEVQDEFPSNYQLSVAHLQNLQQPYQQYPAPSSSQQPSVQMNVSQPLTVVVNNFATSDQQVQNQPLVPPSQIIQQFGQASMPHQQVDNNGVPFHNESSFRQIQQPVTYPIQNNVAVEQRSQSNNQPHQLLQQQRIVEHPPSNFVSASSQQKDSQSVSPRPDSNQYSESQQGQKPQQGDPPTGINHGVDQRSGESNPILPAMQVRGIPSQNFNYQQPLSQVFPQQLPMSSKQSMPLDSLGHASSYQVSQSSNDNVQAFSQQSSHVRSNSVDSEEQKAKDYSQQLSHQNDFNTLLSKQASGSVSQSVIDSHASLSNQQMQSQVFAYRNAQMQPLVDGPSLRPENIFIQPAQPNQNVMSPRDNVQGSQSQTGPASCQTSTSQQLNNPLQTQSFLPQEKSVGQTFFQQQQAQQYQTPLHLTQQTQIHQSQNLQQPLVQQQQLQPLQIQKNFDVVPPQQSQLLQQQSQLLQQQSHIPAMQPIQQQFSLPSNQNLAQQQNQQFAMNQQLPQQQVHQLTQQQAHQLSQQPGQQLTQHSVQHLPQQPQQHVSQQQLQQVPQQQSQQVPQQHAQQVPHQQAQQLPQQQTQQVPQQQAQQVPQQQGQQITQQQSQQVPQQKAQQLPQQVPQQPAQQLPQQQSQQLPQQQSQQLPQQQAQQLLQQQAQQVSQQKVQHVLQQQAQQLPQQQAHQLSQQQVQQLPQQQAQQLPQQQAQQLPQKQAQQLPQQQAQQLPQQHAQQLPQQQAQQLPQQQAQQLPQQQTQQLPQQQTQQLPQQQTQQLPQQQPQQLPQQQSQQLSQQQTQQLPHQQTQQQQAQQLSQQQVQQLPQQQAQQLPQQQGQQLPQQQAQQLPQQQAQQMPQQQAQQMPQQMTQQVPQVPQQLTQQVPQIPQQVPHQNGQQMPQQHIQLVQQQHPPQVTQPQQMQQQQTQQIPQQQPQQLAQQQTRQVPQAQQQTQQLSQPHAQHQQVQQLVQQGHQVSQTQLQQLSQSQAQQLPQDTQQPQVHQLQQQHLPQQQISQPNVQQLQQQPGKDVQQQLLVQQPPTQEFLQFQQSRPLQQQQDQHCAQQTLQQLSHQQFQQQQPIQMLQQPLQHLQQQSFQNLQQQPIQHLQQLIQNYPPQQAQQMNQQQSQSFVQQSTQPLVQMSQVNAQQVPQQQLQQTNPPLQHQPSQHYAQPPCSQVSQPVPQKQMPQPILYQFSQQQSQQVISNENVQVKQAPVLSQGQPPATVHGDFQNIYKQPSEAHKQIQLMSQQPTSAQHQAQNTSHQQQAQLQMQQPLAEQVVPQQPIQKEHQQVHVSQQNFQQVVQQQEVCRADVMSQQQSQTQPKLNVQQQMNIQMPQGQPLPAYPLDPMPQGQPLPAYPFDQMPQQISQNDYQLLRPAPLSIPQYHATPQQQNVEPTPFIQNHQQQPQFLPNQQVVATHKALEPLGVSSVTPAPSFRQYADPVQQPNGAHPVVQHFITSQQGDPASQAHSVQDPFPNKPNAAAVTTDQQVRSDICFSEMTNSYSGQDFHPQPTQQQLIYQHETAGNLHQSAVSGQVDRPPYSQSGLTPFFAQGASQAQLSTVNEISPMTNSTQPLPCSQTSYRQDVPVPVYQGMTSAGQLVQLQTQIQQYNDVSQHIPVHQTHGPIHGEPDTAVNIVESGRPDFQPMVNTGRTDPEELRRVDDGFSTVPNLEFPIAGVVSSPLQVNTYSQIQQNHLPLQEQASPAPTPFVEPSPCCASDGRESPSKAELENHQKMGNMLHGITPLVTTKTMTESRAPEKPLPGQNNHPLHDSLASLMTRPSTPDTHESMDSCGEAGEHGESGRNRRATKSRRAGIRSPMLRVLNVDGTVVECQLDVSKKKIVNFKFDRDAEIDVPSIANTLVSKNLMTSQHVSNFVDLMNELLAKLTAEPDRIPVLEGPATKKREESSASPSRSRAALPTHTRPPLPRRAESVETPLSGPCSPPLSAFSSLVQSPQSTIIDKPAVVDFRSERIHSRGNSPSHPHVPRLVVPTDTPADDILTVIEPKVRKISRFLVRTVPDLLLVITPDEPAQTSATANQSQSRTECEATQYHPDKICDSTELKPRSDGNQDSRLSDQMDANLLFPVDDVKMVANSEVVTFGDVPAFALPGCSEPDRRTTGMSVLSGYDSAGIGGLHGDEYSSYVNSRDSGFAEMNRVQLLEVTARNLSDVLESETTVSASEDESTPHSTLPTLDTEVSSPDGPVLDPIAEQEWEGQDPDLLFTPRARRTSKPVKSASLSHPLDPRSLSEELEKLRRPSSLPVSPVDERVSFPGQGLSRQVQRREKQECSLSEAEVQTEGDCVTASERRRSRFKISSVSDDRDSNSSGRKISANTALNVVMSQVYGEVQSSIDENDAHIQEVLRRHMEERAAFFRRQREELESILKNDQTSSSKASTLSSAITPGDSPDRIHLMNQSFIGRENSSSNQSNTWHGDQTGGSPSLRRHLERLQCDSGSTSAGSSPTNQKRKVFDEDFFKLVNNLTSTRPPATFSSVRPSLNQLRNGAPAMLGMAVPRTGGTYPSSPTKEGTSPLK